MSARTYADLIDDALADGRELVRVEREGAVVFVTMDDPESLNPLGLALTVQLGERLRELAADRTVDAVVLTGTDPAFSAGGDLRAMVESVRPLVEEGPEGVTAMWRWIRYQFSGVVRVIASTDKLFVAAVNGAAAGVGLAFALASDLILASDRARLVTAFGRIGLVPEVGVSWLLTRRLGYHKTLELFLSGRALHAAEAWELGLVNEVVPQDELLDRARWWCEQARALPPHVFPMSKPLLRQAADMTWEQALTMEEFAEPACFTTAGHREAVDAVLARR